MNITHIKMYYSKAQENGNDLIQYLNLPLDFKD